MTKAPSFEERTRRNLRNSSSWQPLQGIKCRRGKGKFEGEGGRSTPPPRQRKHATRAGNSTVDIFQLFTLGATPL